MRSPTRPSTLTLKSTACQKYLCALINFRPLPNGLTSTNSSQQFSLRSWSDIARHHTSEEIDAGTAITDIAGGRACRRPPCLQNRDLQCSYDAGASPVQMPVQLLTATPGHGCKRTTNSATGTEESASTWRDSRRIVARSAAADAIHDG